MLAVAATVLVVLVFVWVGYPLLVALVASPRRAARTAGAARATRSEPSAIPGSGPAATPRVSVVVASADVADDIRARVRNLLDTAYPADRLEVVVALDAVNGRATAAELAGVDDRLHVVTGDQPGGKSSTLNAGVRAAAGEILVLTDTHQRFDPESIPALVRALEEDARLGAVSGALAVSGGRRPRTPGEWYWHFERRLRADEALLHSVVGVTGAIYAMRRALWAPLPAGLLLDDLYVPMRLVLAGHRVGFNEEARAVDGRTFDARQEFRRKVRTLTGNVQLVAWLPRVLLPWRNPIWLQFVCHKLLRLLTPYLALILAAAVGAWIVTSLWRAAGWMGLLAAAALPALALLHPGLRRRVVRQAEWVVLMQAAAMLAMANGVRGRWTVWQR